MFGEGNLQFRPEGIMGNKELPEVYARLRERWRGERDDGRVLPRRRLKKGYLYCIIHIREVNYGYNFWRI
jgi:hypothetical protein